MTTIDDLVRLVPPPLEPRDARGDWAAVEEVVGVRLPADFKALVGRYGAGEFVDLITPLTPFGERQPFIEHARLLLPDEAPFRDQLLGPKAPARVSRDAKYPDDCPHPFYPEPGGLLVWATTSNDDRLCWLTEGDPGAWPVIAWNPRSVIYERHQMGAVEFLHGWLSGQITDDLFSALDVAPWFEPFRELMHVYVRLAEGRLPYAERLGILRDAVAPTVDRGSFDGGDAGRQDHFAAIARDWRLTYETAYGHQIRIAFPPEDEEQARVVVVEAARRMGCRVLSTTTHAGAPIWQ